MNNLNKKMSLAVKLMTLAVMMNIATGCDSCKENNKANTKAAIDVTLAFNPTTLPLKDTNSKLKLTNNSDGELDTSDASKLKLAVVATVTMEPTVTLTDQESKTLKDVDYEIEGGYKGKLDGNEKLFDLKNVVGQDKMGSKVSIDRTFKFDGLTTFLNTAGTAGKPGAVKQIVFKVTLKDDKGDKASTTLTWNSK